MDDLLQHHGLSEDTVKKRVKYPPTDDVGDIVSVDMWLSLLPKLEIPHDVVKWINPNFSMKQQADYYFYKWKKRKGSRATYKKLIWALLEIHDVESAERICSFLVNHQEGLVKTSSTDYTIQGM